jgi:hypothetical protein
MAIVAVVTGVMELVAVLGAPVADTGVSVGSGVADVRSVSLGTVVLVEMAGTSLDTVVLVCVGAAEENVSVGRVESLADDTATSVSVGRAASVVGADEVVRTEVIVSVGKAVFEVVRGGVFVTLATAVSVSAGRADVSVVAVMVEAVTVFDAAAGLDATAVLDATMLVELEEPLASTGVPPYSAVPQSPVPPLYVEWLV